MELGFHLSNKDVMTAVSQKWLGGQPKDGCLVKIVEQGSGPSLSVPVGRALWNKRKRSISTSLVKSKILFRAMVNPEGHYHTRGMVTGNPAIENWELHTRLRHTELQASLEAEPVPSSWRQGRFAFISTFHFQGNCQYFHFMCTSGGSFTSTQYFNCYFLTLSGASVY